MAERLIMPVIEPQVIDIDGSPTLVTPSKRERDVLHSQILDRLKMPAGNGWTVKPKRWKFGGSTFYGLMFERKL